MKSVPVFCGKDCGGGACPLLLEIEGGRGLRVLANPAGGHFIKACRRGFDLVKEHYAPDRLTKPLIRTGPRGSGLFREAGWVEALALIAARLGDIRAKHGAASVLSLASSGCVGALHGSQALTKRFLNVTGGCTVFSGNYSKGAAQAVLPYLFGSRWNESGTDAATMKSSAMIILWGANLLDTRLGSEMPRRLLEAKQRGVPIIAIDPRRTTTVKHAATWWIPCRPGTDAALMLAVLHVLLSESLVDLTRIGAIATGFDSLARSVLGQDGGTPRTPEWAETICGVPAAEIRRFAHAYAAAHPAMLIPGFSIQRVSAGEETYRLTAALQLATGNFGARGGSTGSLNNSLPTLRVGTMSAMMSPGQPSIPVLRWPDAILQGTSGGYPTDIHAVYLAGGNFLNQGGGVRKSMAAFEALDFAVCHELFLTPTARHCDVVLPAASPLEKEDIGIPWLGNYLLYKPAALPPVGSARSDYDIYCDLSNLMGAGSEFCGGRSAAQWIDAFLAASEVPDHEEFRRTGIYLAAEQERVGLEDFASDPTGHPLDTPSGKVEIESESYARVTGFPALPGWRDRGADARHPLSLITPKRAEKTHSQLGDRSSPLGPADHALHMHPADAARRGIGPGDEARIFNQNGVVHIRVTITEDIMPGVVSLHEGVWVQLDENGEDRAGSANMLTDTEGTGPERACIMHALPVEVARGFSGPGTIVT
ncbi:MAG: molybdopterin-dependent oxidoreductase [Spirochaetes bacterium]|nr:molybdopterin-dependent oxidoreductase [Spirochaetota bacterium]